jgi:hypothetical protein
MWNLFLRSDPDFPKKVESLDRTQDVSYTFDCFVSEIQVASKNKG